MVSKEIINRFILVALGTVIGLICAEVITRLSSPSYSDMMTMNRSSEDERNKYARYDPVLGWDGKENAEGDFIWKDTSHHVHQNRFGYRGNEYDPKRKRGRRFVVLGDSYVWGFGVNDNEIFTRVMEDRVAGEIEMMNMGVSGFGTDQEYLLWTRKGHRWDPDDVLLVVTLENDLMDNFYASRYGYLKPLFLLDEQNRLILTNVPVPLWKDTQHNDPQKNAGKNNLLKFLSSHSAFFCLILDLGMSNDFIKEYLASHDVLTVESSREYPLYYASQDRETGPVWDTLFVLIRELNADIVKRRTKLTVVIIPSRLQVYPAVWEKFQGGLDPRIAARLDPDAPSRYLAEWCRNNKINVIDLLPGFRNAGVSAPDLYYPLNRHWTAAGHRVAAEILLKELHLR